jgi:hypothetical protein
MTARIYQPARTAMQSGTGNTQRWLLVHETQQPRGVDPLTGWTSSVDTRQQVKLWFDTAEQAIAYATREGIAYTLELPQKATRRTMSYSDNFRFNRVGQWSH